jgi:TetR/AcrR family transcriptional regulator, fatty acid metabolism regulator protein
VECAIDVIAEEGFGRASLSRIAERAGVAKSVVLYHFANKDELVEQVMHAVSMASAAELPARLAAATGALDGLRSILEMISEFVATHRNHALAGLEAANRMRSLPGRAKLAASPDPSGVDAIRQGLVEGQRTGELGDFDPYVMAVMFRQAIEAVVLEAALRPEPDLTAFTAELMRMFERTLGRTHGEEHHDHRGGVAR